MKSNILTLLFTVITGIGRIQSQECPPIGDGGDTTLNKLKNRKEIPGSFIEKPVQAFLTTMPIVNAHHKFMDKFSKVDRAKIDSVDRLGLALEGFIVAAKQSEPEACNCHMATKRDFHVWIAPEQPPEGDKDSAKAIRARSVIVEPTPYWQGLHKDTWRIRILSRLAKDRTKVRISGWAMYDPEHPGELGKTRGTLWEIHPVTKIEVWNGGVWREL